MNGAPVPTKQRKPADVGLVGPSASFTAVGGDGLLRSCAIPESNDIQQPRR